jgi:hypothetical protein
VIMALTLTAGCTRRYGEADDSHSAAAGEAYRRGQTKLGDNASLPREVTIAQASRIPGDTSPGADAVPRVAPSGMSRSTRLLWTSARTFYGGCRSFFVTFETFSARIHPEDFDRISADFASKPEIFQIGQDARGTTKAQSRAAR